MTQEKKRRRSTCIFWMVNDFHRKSTNAPEYTFAWGASFMEVNKDKSTKVGKTNKPHFYWWIRCTNISFSRPTAGPFSLLRCPTINNHTHQIYQRIFSWLYIFQATIFSSIFLLFMRNNKKKTWFWNIEFGHTSRWNITYQQGNIMEHFFSPLAPYF